MGLPLPVNQPVDYAKHDTPIALACALGGSTKLSAGGFVLVSVEDGICNPAVDVGFMPAGPIGADFELGRERALSDLAVNGGPGQPGPGKGRFSNG